MDSDSGMVYGNQALVLSQKLKWNKGIAETLRNIGTYYYLRANYPLSLEYYLRSLKIEEACGNKKGIASCLSNIGVVYKGQEDYDKSLEYYSAAFKIDSSMMNKKGMAADLGNIGNAYKGQNNISKALEYHQKALKLYTELKNSKGMALNLGSIGNDYKSISQYDEALKNYLESLKLYEEIGNKSGITITLSNMGFIYLQQNKNKLAEECFLKSLKIGKESGLTKQVMEAEEYLSEVYKKNGNYKKAFDHYKNAMILKDSIFNEEKNKEITRKEMTYEFEKKEAATQAEYDKKTALQNAEIIITKAEVERKNIITYILVVSILLIILLSYLIYNRYKLKQEALLSAELLRQQDLRSKAIIEAEENERMRIARDLHDGVGQTLSAAKLNLSSLENKLKLTEIESQSALKNAMELVDDSVKEVRSVSHSMMPNALLKSGLVAAVREFINKLTGIDKLKIDLEITGLNQRLEPTTETILFRVLQEIVSNILKHAKANHITIQLIKHDNELTIIIEDNGVGFDTKKLNESGGIGLKNITSRIEFLQGRVDFDSNVGKGTTVIIEVPV
ncbi:MAG: tetratricopeptide repeat protein [Bacteroidetes bacterium]|jgi:signal transduction histidine kinase|nr:tetratricopeptide repeat protein [Bacteroidota bacterium]